MNTKTINLLFVTLFLISANVFSQTFTMGKKCRISLETAQNALAEEAYTEALTYYKSFTENCKTKDAKEIGAYEKAEVLNHLERYDEAIVEADKALKVSKNTSLNAYFQKAIALHKKGKPLEAKEALDQVIKLTENNENVKERASNYALMAAFYERKMNDIVTAQEYLNKAKELDATNIHFLIQEGDMYVHNGNYDEGFKSYDEALNIDENSKELFIARSEARFKQVSEKYGSSNAQELRSKMTKQEKNNLCNDLSIAIELGYKDMSKELLKSLICK